MRPAAFAKTSPTDREIELEAEVEHLRHLLNEMIAPVPEYAEFMLAAGLTRCESAVLTMILRAKGRVVTHESLTAATTFAMRRLDGATPNTIRVQVFRIRMKLAAAGMKIDLRPVRGVGYALDTPP